MIRCFIFFAVWCFSLPAMSQRDAKNDLIVLLTPAVKPAQKWQVAQNNKTMGQRIFSGLFLIYKKTISSQDHNHCSFEPSCSEYAILSLKKHGVFIAFMDAADRLLRCNGMSPENYDFNPETELLVDFP